MSVNEEHRMQCPKCHADHALDIAASIFVRLTPDGTDPDQAQTRDHEWDDDSAVHCGSCGWGGRVWQARLPEYCDDDYEALMPDGSRVPWDDRLRTTDALKVLRLEPVPFAVTFTQYAEEVAEGEVMANTWWEARQEARKVLAEGDLDWEDGTGSQGHTTDVTGRILRG